jgi:hypothetical protein
VLRESEINRNNRCFLVRRRQRLNKSDLNTTNYQIMKLEKDLSRTFSVTSLSALACSLRLLSKAFNSWMFWTGRLSLEVSLLKADVAVGAIVRFLHSFFVVHTTFFPQVSQVSKVHVHLKQ